MSGRRPVLAALVAAPIAIVGAPALAVTQIARAGGSARAGAAVIGDSPIGTVDDSGQVGRTYVFPASVAATMPPAPVPGRADISARSTPDFVHYVRFSSHGVADLCVRDLTD